MLEVRKWGQTNVRPNGELIEEVDCFKCSGSQVAADGECERDVVQKMNERHKAWRALEYMPSNYRIG